MLAGCREAEGLPRYHVKISLCEALTKLLNTLFLTQQILQQGPSLIRYTKCLHNGSDLEQLVCTVRRLANES